MTSADPLSGTLIRRFKMSIRRKFSPSRLTRRHQLQRLGCEPLERRLALATVRIGSLTLNVTGSVASVTDCVETAKAVAIPASVAISGGGRATVTEIGSDAFQKCRQLTTVSIPASVQTIGTRAFQGCSRLKNIGLPGGLTRIGERAFEDCVSLTGLPLPVGVTELGESSFEGCKGLTSIAVPAGVTVIGDSSFEGCTGLKSVSLANGLKTVGDWAFQGCSGLTTVAIPASVTELGASSFEGCKGLKSVSLTNGLKTVGYDAFKDCSGLTTVAIPASVTQLGVSSFEGCKGLKSVSLANGLETVPTKTFRGCSGLTTVAIPASVTALDASSFEGCTGLKSVSLANGLKTVGYDAFKDCSGLTTVAIPASVTELGWGSFEGCKGLTSIAVDDKSSAYASIAGLLYERGSSGGFWLLECPEGKVGAVSIASGTSSVGMNAFTNCRAVTSVTVPASVTLIENWGDAFAGCAKLKTIDFSGKAPEMGFWGPPPPYGEPWEIQFESQDLYGCTAVVRYPAGSPDWGQTTAIYGLKARGVPTPAAPTALSAVAGDGTATISWKAPINTGDAAISDYLIQFTRDNGKTWSVFNDGVSATSSAKVTGLVNNQSHLFRVAAVTFAGTGAFSLSSQPITPRK